MFKLKKPNSRFHALFTVRWNAMWMMPKHVFEKAGEPGKFAFNPPVTLGSYKLHSFDTNGKWFIWEKRADWQRTTLAKFGEPGPRYVAYIDPGPPDKRVILQLNHQLDVIHDTSPEGRFTLAKEAPNTSHGWFKGFPYAHPDPTLPAVLLNHQNPMFQNRDVRWALALLIDMKAVSMASYRGAATISCHRRAAHRQVRRTTTSSRWSPGCSDFELDTGKRKFKPYDPTVGQADRRPCCAPRWATRSPPIPRRSPAAFGARLVEAESRRPPPNCCSGPASPSAATTGTPTKASRSPSTSRWKATCAR